MDLNKMSNAKPEYAESGCEIAVRLAAQKRLKAKQALLDLQASEAARKAQVAK